MSKRILGVEDQEATAFLWNSAALCKFIRLEQR
jgi:hypothetical protein